MATRTHEPRLLVPMGRPAASSSLPLELKALLNEFGNKFWQFDATRIARMLSPNVTPPSNLVSVAYSLLEQKPSDWPNGGEDTSFHEPLVDSLNDFVDASHRALDLCDPLIIERDARWYTDLQFMQIGDGACGAHGRDHGSIKREAVAGICFRKKDLAIPVKFDEDWPAVVAQAARSAQILYSTCHLRKFVLVIGFRYTTLELRFLIIHRGGVTASKPLSVVEEQGKKGILRVFLSTLMWRSGEDAGVPEFARAGLSLNVPGGAL